MTLQAPWPWAAGDDALSDRLRSMTDAILQLQGETPGTGGELDFAKLRQTTTQSLTSASFTTITFDVEDRDDASGHAAGSGIYTVQIAGEIFVQAGIAFAANGTGLRGIRFLHNGSASVQGRLIVSPAPAANPTEVSLTHIITCAAGDTIAVQGRQDSGGALSTAYTASEQGCYMNIRWVHS